MPFFIPIHVAKTFSASTDQCRDASGMRAKPECVVLGVADGVTPSTKPPVRIFLGTEPAQYRAERVFVWSIERVRDPSRIYEIYLMKELAGFNRRRWLTGFTNYRFAIPHYTGGAGRAIWNDVDQAYLADPAELFDADMGDHGFLAIAPGGRTDTAVMLLDCARMAQVWTLEDAQHKHKNALIAKTTAIPGLRGDLAPEWHARDEEYVPGRTKLLHWTILHTQPWRPLPQLFVYQRNPAGEVWHDLKRSADAAGYSVFSADRPSAQYNKLLTQLQAAAAEGRSSAPDGSIARRLPKERPPTHPGEMLLEEFLKPLDISQSAFAIRLGVSFPRLNEIIRGKRSVTPDTALRLDRVLGMPADFWLGLQHDWDLWHAMRSDKAGGIADLEPLRLT